MSQLTKWLAWYSPLFAGRFDFFTARDGAQFNALARGLILTRGRFWVRVHGGHDLRRAIERLPGLSDPIVGRADGKATTVGTFPWVGHAPSAAYWYALHVVGAGGVGEAEKAPHVKASFDAADALIGPAPNPVTHLSVEPMSGGRFRLAWRYDERAQEVAPADFQVYNDTATPGAIDYAMPVATVEYGMRAGAFEYVSAAFSHGAMLMWAVRARSSAGVVEANAMTVTAIADAQPPSAIADLLVTG